MGNYYMASNGELYHWGVKGMKWGVRRYQDKDGGLTPAGKKRYARDAREKGYNKQDEDDGTYYKTAGKKGGRKETLDVDADRYVTEDMQRTKRVADDASQMAGKLKQINENAMKKQPKERQDLSTMSDKELRDRINREMLERQYNDMFTPQTKNRGRERVNDILETTGTVLVVAGSAVQLALSIRELMKR